MSTPERKQNKMQIKTLRLSPSKMIQRNDWTVPELVTR
jgi:hypothetical protein